MNQCRPPGGLLCIPPPDPIPSHCLSTSLTNNMMFRKLAYVFSLCRQISHLYRPPQRRPRIFNSFGCCPSDHGSGKRSERFPDEPQLHDQRRRPVSTSISMSLFVNGRLLSIKNRTRVDVYIFGIQTEDPFVGQLVAGNLEVSPQYYVTIPEDVN